MSVAEPNQRAIADTIERDYNTRTIVANSLLSSGRLRELVDAFLELIKIRITFFVGMSAMFGYILASSSFSLSFILPVLGIFILSCGSAVLNHYQERHTDSLMHRTSRRPLPAGTVRPSVALWLTIVLAVSGSALVYATSNLPALGFSLMAFLWYNAIYTPLKKVTAFAVIPGSLVGSLPVIAGWAAAGGNVVDGRLLSVASFFFVWQIPHFWLLMDIYQTDYERAGFPVIGKYLSKSAFGILTFASIIVLVASSAAFVISGLTGGPVVALALASLGAWLVKGTYQIVPGKGDKRIDKTAFLKINIYVLAVTLIVMIDKVLRFI